MKFIPYSFADTDGTFYDMRPVMSFGTPIVAIIGARRIGKTFSAKKLVLKKFIEKGEMFAWLRDSDEARKKLAMDGGAKFFSDVPKTGLKLDGKIDGERIIVNDKTAGYLMPSSTFQSYKGNDFEDVKTIIYDEFIPERNRRRNTNQGWEIINMLYTIASTRTDIRIILLANALDSSNEILSIFGVNIKDYGIYVNRDKCVALHYADNHPDFNVSRETSVLGKLIKGTQYEDNLFHNKFGDDTDLFFDKLPTKSVFLYCIKTEKCVYRVYASEAFLYCRRDNDGDAYRSRRFTANYALVDSVYRLLPKDVRGVFKRYFDASLIRYQDAFVKSAVESTLF